MVPRLRESRLLTPSGHGVQIHATWGPLFCPALYIIIGLLFRYCLGAKVKHSKYKISNSHNITALQLDFVRLTCKNVDRTRRAEGAACGVDRRQIMAAPRQEKQAMFSSTHGETILQFVQSIIEVQR